MTGNDVVERARALAADLHAGDTRKGTDIPYFEGHLEPVADLVRAVGGTDEQVAAAYLHDAAEDHGGSVTLDRIRVEIGSEVGDIVADLSDSLVDTQTGEAKAPWPQRKQAYLRKLADKPVVSLEVSVADKLQNAQCMLSDHQRIGDELWARFNEKRPEAQLWYYVSLAEVFRRRIPQHPLTKDLTDVVDELERRVRAQHPELPIPLRGRR